MNDSECSYGEAQGRVIQVLRDQHPEWVDAGGECPACVPAELELAATNPTANHEPLNPPNHDGH